MDTVSSSVVLPPLFSVPLAGAFAWQPYRVQADLCSVKSAEGGCSLPTIWTQSGRSTVLREVNRLGLHTGSKHHVLSVQDNIRHSLRLDDHGGRDESAEDEIFDLRPDLARSSLVDICHGARASPTLLVSVRFSDESRLHVLLQVNQD